MIWIILMLFSHISFISSEECVWHNHTLNPWTCFNNCTGYNDYHLVRRVGSCFLSMGDYCCPSSGTGADVIFCKGTDFNGDCVVQSFQPYTKRCENIVQANQTWSSVNTLGNCIRVFTEENCLGKSIMLAPGMKGQEDISVTSIEKVSSFSECFEIDVAYYERFSAQKKKMKRANKDRYEIMRKTIERLEAKLKDAQETDDEEFLRHCCKNENNELDVGITSTVPFQIIEDKRFPGRIIEYQVDPATKKTLAMRTTLKAEHLGQGTAVTDETRKHARRLGYDNDDAGHILAKQLGGFGEQDINIFPQNPYYNNGLWKRVENFVAKTVRTFQAVRFVVNLNYVDDATTRPFALTFSVHLSIEKKEYLVGAVPNPKNETIVRAGMRNVGS